MALAIPIIDLEQIKISSKELSSKSDFDRVAEKGKPESVNSGSINHRDSGEELKDGTNNNSILAVSPNFYKQNGESVANSGYFIIPRSVTSDPRYQSARLKYKHVLHILFENVAFAPTTHAIGTEIILIGIGQFCVTVRGLMDLCNVGVKFKEDKVDKNTIERASHFWRTCGFVRQEVRHGKIILTITVPEFYIRSKTQSETGSETKVRLNRDTKEEDKEYKKKNKHPQTPSFSIPEKIKFRENVQLTQTEFDSLVEMHSKDFVDKMLDTLDSYKGSKGVEYKSDFHVMKKGSWLFNRIKDEELKSNFCSSKNSEANESLAREIEKKYSDFTKGWRCRIYNDTIKDQKGLLFEPQSPYVKGEFTAFSNVKFREEVSRLLKIKNMGEI